ncbi:Phospholipase D4 [Bienertia sinuspersici]
MKFSVVILVGVFLFATFFISSSTNEECKAWLVQSIPTDMPQLPLVPGLDIMTQYWQLIAGQDNPLSGDYGYSKEEMEVFGAQEGLSVYEAIQNAADHNVVIRLLQHSGVYPDYTKEPTELATGRSNVESVTLLLGKWWGSGIVHVKVWISDDRDVYIGSANNDWKSLTQVKEAGIYIADCPEIAKKVEVYFNNLWMLGLLNASEYTTTTWDQQWQINRTVPCWSHFVATNERCKSPLHHDYVKVRHVAGYPLLSDPHMFHLPIQTPGYNNSLRSQHSSSYLSFAPPELSFGKFQTDEQGWMDTITSVGTGAIVRISTMDWLGQSQYTEQTVYWWSLRRKPQSSSLLHDGHISSTEQIHI